MTIGSTMAASIEGKNEAAVPAGPKVSSVEALKVAGGIEAKSTGYTFGCDLGDKHSDVCVLDAQGQVVERAQIRSTKKGFEGYFGSREPSRVAIEVGSHSRWVSTLLKALGHDVVVANPRQVKLISQNHKKRDGIDAELLARIARVDPTLLFPIKHRSAAAHADMCIIQARDLVVKNRTALVNAVRGMVKAQGTRLPSGGSSESFHKKVELIPEQLKPALVPMMTTIEHLTGQIREYDKLISDKLEQHPESKALLQIAGVGPITALAFMGTIEDPERFKKSRDVPAYFGLVPKKNQSGDRDPELGITKAGSPLVRRLLVQCAHYIMGPFGPETDLRSFGERLASRGGKNAKKRASVAVARKLAVLLHRLWVTGEVYEPVGYGKPVKAAEAAA